MKDAAASPIPDNVDNMVQTRLEKDTCCQICNRKVAAVSHGTSFQCDICGLWFHKECQEAVYIQQRICNICDSVPLRTHILRIAANQQKILQQVSGIATTQQEMRQEIATAKEDIRQEIATAKEDILQRVSDIEKKNLGDTLNQ